MNGKDHVLLTELSLLAALAPWMTGEQIPWLLALFAGSLLGSLAPDADAPDASIFHAKRKGKNIFRLVPGYLFPLTGYILRYLVYYPVSAFLFIISFGSVRPRHRGFLHSLGGIALSSLVIFGGAWLLSLWAGISPPSFLIPAGAGFFIGCAFHLLEDSCTKGGICPLFPPLQVKINGTIVTGDRRELRPVLFAVALGGCAALTCSSRAILPADSMLSLLPALACAILWIFFLLWSGVRVFWN
ncbi:MAG: metal-dependent hydrolase [Methanomicrobiaceae archaeon]|nr:metal-dependent hydrolase [Methanomicrobiaceae archaeon]